MANSLAILEALLLKQPETSAIDYVDGIVMTASPLTVRCTGEDTDSPAEPVGRPMVTGERVAVITIGKRRLAIPYGLTSDPALVPWTVPNRHVTIGPNGDINPILELQRSRPSYLADALMYLAANSSTTEFAIALADNGVTQATLRLTKTGLLLQNNVTGVTRYVAYQDDVDSLKLKASGSVTVSVSASAGGTANVTFPTGRFLPSHNLNIQLTKASGVLAKFIPYAQSVSNTGMTVGVYSGDGSVTTGSVVVYWSAEVRRD